MTDSLVGETNLNTIDLCEKEEPSCGYELFYKGKKSGEINIDANFVRTTP